jgi:hypothetical protein
MDDLLVSLLGMVLEILLELGGEAIIDLLSRFASDAFRPNEPPNPATSWLACAVLGVLGGAASLVAFPHHLFPSTKFRGVSLIIGPATAGLVMHAVGKFLRRRGKKIVQIESFPYAFAFAFGMAVVRFLFAS